MEKIASVSGNLKGTFKHFLREAAGNSHAYVTKLSKRNSTATSEIALEQENLQLRAKTYELELKCAKLGGSLSNRENPFKKNEKAGIQKNTPFRQIFPSPPQPSSQTVLARASWKDSSMQANDFALLVQMVEVVKNMAADLATLRQEVR